MSEINVDRFMGSLVGLAIGDAIGKQVEFRRIGTFRPVTDMNDGGTYRDLSAGQWTDDTSVNILLSILMPLLAMFVHCKEFSGEKEV